MAHSKLDYLIVAWLQPSMLSMDSNLASGTFTKIRPLAKIARNNTSHGSMVPKYAVPVISRT